MELVSVIVPVYKAETFLAVCVESISGQTYENLEIILVDDGSPDSCPSLCDEYAAKDNRIKVIHKQNGGASSARNAGIDAANGRFICFVDSDDVIPKNSIEILINSIITSNGQYAAGICGIIGSEKVKNPILNDTCIDISKNPEAFLKYLTQSGSYSPYAKIFDGNIVRKHNIRFDTGLKCSEDALFIRQYLKHCQRICLCSKKVYMYNTGNPNSLSKKLYPEYSSYYVKKLEALSDIIDILPVSEQTGKAFLAWRALHGLRLSVNQYVRFDGNDERMSLTGRAIEQLYPWFKGHEYFENDIGLLRWYKKCSAALNSSDTDKSAKRLLSCARTDYMKIKLRMFIAGLTGH